MKIIIKILKNIEMFLQVYMNNGEVLHSGKQENKIKEIKIKIFNGNV